MRNALMHPCTHELPLYNLSPRTVYTSPMHPFLVHHSAYLVLACHGGMRPSPFTITRAQGTTTKSLLNLQQEGGRKIRKRVSIKAQQANNAVLFSPERGLANNAYCSHLKEAEHGHQHQEATPFCSSNGVALSSPLPFAITSLLFLAFVNIVFPFTVGLRHEKARV